MAQSGSLSQQTEILSQVSSLMETFRAFDADNDGFISTAELGGILSSLGHTVSQDDLKVMMEQGDRNGDRLLSIEEFLEMTTDKIELGGLTDSLTIAFETLDANGEEAVTGEELYEILKNTGIGLSKEACQDIIASMDEDGDGAVSFEDFKLIVNSLS
ncbi:Calmodulin [Thalictrum thalictroides]|uniref:Calmodulin n=1 Tax=Thalictrum thalictroides TaxID=46969 RepID=A0A7J6W913_THATH|nr:Calmodulin [Thalictrum thalictroides]